MSKNIHYKLVLFGDTAVGKSCLVTRFVNDQFFEFQEPTIGAAFSTKNILLNDKTIKFEIWDTAGQERYRSLAPMYYRGATAAIVVYDITNKNSFNGAKAWIQELKNRGPNDCVIVLAGNKSDLEQDREILKSEVEEYAYTKNIIHMNTSAKTNLNITEIFEKIAITLLNNNKRGINQPINLLDNNRQYKNRDYYSCCY